MQREGFMKEYDQGIDSECSVVAASWRRLQHFRGIDAQRKKESLLQARWCLVVRWEGLGVELDRGAYPES